MRVVRYESGMVSEWFESDMVSKSYESAMVSEWYERGTVFLCLFGMIVV